MSRYLTAGLLLLAAAVLVGCGKSTATEEQTAHTGTAGDFRYAPDGPRYRQS